MIPFSSSYTLTRRQPGRYVRGNWQESETFQQVFIDASIQPVTYDELQLLPDGQRTIERIDIYTEFALIAADKKKSTLGDLVLFRGAQFEVIAVEEFDQPNTPLPHFHGQATITDVTL